jgi:cystathionine beta-lyase
MSPNFDEVIDRRASDGIKWLAYPADVLPMWVADMDFRSPEPVVQALRERVEHGVFGYAATLPGLVDAIVAWAAERYGWRIEREHVVMLPGLVSGLNSVVRAYGHIGDSTIMLSPIYGPMFSSSYEQGMRPTLVPLVTTQSGATVRFEIDFDAFEKAIAPRTTIMMLCHPHNPVGREFTREELLRLGEIALKHNLIICSDEIHGDLMLDGRRHTPFASLSPELANRTVTLMAPSKTFNVPGLGCSFAIVTNPHLRQRLNGAISGILPHNNVLGMVAAEASFKHGGPWLADLQAYLTGSRDMLVQYVAEHMPHVAVTVPEATYLAFLDFRSAGLNKDPYAYFLSKAKVALSGGTGFGAAGEGFARFNFGCPRSTMMEALERMAEALPVNG